MAKPGQLNAELLQGTELAGGLRQRVISVGTTPLALETDSINTIWIIVQNISSVNIYIGGSDVANSGSKRGIIARPFGETPPLKVHNLNELFVIAASGSANEVAYLAGLPGE